MEKKILSRLEKLNMAIVKGFIYNPNSGEITSPTGVIIKKKTKNGYIQLTIRNSFSHAYYVSGHQFAWFVLYNETVNCIDHINRIKTDNRPANLRSVTTSQNSMNMSNTKGYTYCSRSKKYIAIIMTNYKKKQLGVFESPQEARNCYLENKNKYHNI
jgi:hypothetical protein